MQNRKIAAAGLTATAAVTGLALAGVSGAQQAPAPGAPPTVTIDLEARSVALDATELAAGPTRLVFRNADGARNGRVGNVLALEPGQTVDDIRASLRKRGPAPPPRSVGSVVAGAAPAPRGGESALTLTLKPSTTYVFVETSGQNATRWPTTLPRKGVVRFRATGNQPHFAVAFPLKPAADEQTVMRQVRRNQEREFSKAIGGQPSDPHGLVTRGAVNDQEVSFARPGRYLLVCFYSNGPRAKGHHQRGMVRAVTVE